MTRIWYLLKCPKGNEADYAKRCREFGKIRGKDLQEVVCFQYQRMLRYGGKWHMEKRTLLPGCIFLFGPGAALLKGYADTEMFIEEKQETDRQRQTEQGIFIIPCETPYLKNLCPEGNVVGMSKGIIKNGRTFVTSGPLQGKEHLIQKIDRHKRTAEIEIPFSGQKIQVTVGLEIYQKLLNRQRD